MKPWLFVAAASLLACTLFGPTATTAPAGTSTSDASATVAQPATPTRRAATPTVRGAGPTLEATARPSLAPHASATPRPTTSPEPTATSTRRPGPPPPDFLKTVAGIKRQMEIFGGIIDIAFNGSGAIDCNEVITVHDSVTTAPLLNVANSLAGANQLYRQGVDNFTSKTRDMYLNCQSFLANNSNGAIPFQQWGPARQGVSESVDLLRQSIIAAGGTP